MMNGVSDDIMMQEQSIILPISPQANNDLENTTTLKNNDSLSSTNSLACILKLTTENFKDLDEDMMRVDEGKSSRKLLIANPGYQTADANDKSSAYNSPIECTDWTSVESQIKAKNPKELERAETEVINVSSNNFKTTSTLSSKRTVSHSIASDEAVHSGKVADAPMSGHTDAQSNGYPAASEEEVKGEPIGATVVKVYSRDEGTSSWSWMITSDLNQNVSEEKNVKKTYSYRDGTWSWEDQRVRLSINTADYEGSIPTPCCPIVEGTSSQKLEVEENTKIGSNSSGGSLKAFNLLLLLGLLYAALVAGLVIHRCGVSSPEHPNSMQNIPRAETFQSDAELFRNLSMAIEYSPSNYTASIATAVELMEDVSSDVESKKVLVTSTTETLTIKTTITARALNGLKNFVSAITGSVARCFQAIRKALSLF